MRNVPGRTAFSPFKLPWREISAFLQSVECERTPEAFLRKTLESVGALVAFDFGVAIFSNPGGTPVVIGLSASAELINAWQRSFSHGPVSPPPYPAAGRMELSSPAFTICLYKETGTFSALDDRILEALRHHLDNLFAAVMRPVESRVRGLLDTASRAGLSAREREIYILLCGRLTIAEISQQLSISTHTARKHIEHIYDKLLVSGRRGACAPRDVGGQSPLAPGVWRDASA
jgi:DNA-binding CsgD family transcriptional regulator